MKQSLLLSPFQLNTLFTLKNRIVMAPMTRLRSDNNFLPTQPMADYYARRADAGLIITEGTVIASNAHGHVGVPGMFNEAQIDAWKPVTDAVRKNKGLIFNQIWHVGRVSHPALLEGALPVSSSATIMSGRIPRMDGYNYGVARALTVEEIKSMIASFAESAKNAIKAGFDGIELHGANGYLIDQFLHYDTNRRTDEYGGTPENMARFAYEIVKACGEAIGYERVGIRLSPAAYLNEIAGDVKDVNVFSYLLDKLSELPIAYVHTGNYNHTQRYEWLLDMTMPEFVRKHYLGTVIGCGGYDFESADNAVENGEVDLIAMGRPFIANPDLIARFSARSEIKPYDVSLLQTLY